MFGRRGVNSDCGQRVDDDRDACLESLQTLVAWALALFKSYTSIRFKSYSLGNIKATI
jgi:hypothetical protein